MRTIIKNIAIAAGAALALSACGGGSGGVASTTPTPGTTVTPASFQSRFGTQFAADFNANSNTAEPVKPSASDVPALNLTAEPLDN